ncbi:hypothetical protein L916_05480 [Phytophthora nicotianae]|uniref:Uncharacterized protein n=1 Tax=Phytophthora nicotianae TaxID=4792 RepID=W2JCL8_PHYNI|nr:hypothetical protein L916_05480 [Phytophthora nicotianae]
MEHVLESKGVAAGNITRELLREEIHNLLAEVGLQRNIPIRDAVATTAPKRSCMAALVVWEFKPRLPSV